MSEGKWLRVGQVAAKLGVSVGTARNYIDAGKFRRVRRLSAGDRRVWSVDVDRYIAEIEHDMGDATGETTPGEPPSGIVHPGSTSSTTAP